MDYRAYLIKNAEMSDPERLRLYSTLTDLGAMGGWGGSALLGKMLAEGDVGLEPKQFKALAGEAGVPDIKLKPGQDYSYIPGEHTVTTPHTKPKMHIAGHEVGHASGWAKHPTYRNILRVGDLLRNPLIRYLSTTAAALPLGYYLMDPNKSEKENLLRLGGAGALVGGALTAPMLFEEGRASARALKLLAKLKLARSAKGIGSLVAGFGTYAIPALATGAAGAMWGGSFK